MTQLATGDKFPSISAKDLDGNEVDLADAAAGRWSVVFFYRGHW